jgi:hypothetical protein
MNFKTLFDLSAEKIDFFKGSLPIAYLFLIIGIGLITAHVQKGKRQGSQRTC